MTNSSKAIVIGAGHNGLVCSTYLAKAGYDVEIVEARKCVGGAATTSEFAPGYRVSGVAHILHSLHPKICKDLGLSNAETKYGPALDTISLDSRGRHITLGAQAIFGDDLPASDVKAYPRFKQEYSRYAKALDPLFMNKPPRLKDMDLKDKMTLAKLGWRMRFGLGTSAMREFFRVGGINIFDALNEVFENERLKAAIAVDAVLGHHMGPRTPTTVLTYLTRLYGETHSAQQLPLGGMGGVADALERAAAKAGVAIRTGAQVSDIVVAEGRAAGVRLTTGEELDSDIVVSNADARNTFMELVGARNLDAMFVHRVNKTRAGGNVAKLHLALDKLPDFVGLAKEQIGGRLLVAPSMRYIEHAFNHAKYGEFSDHPVLEIVIPTVADRSLAPSGHHVVSICASYAPYDLRGGWEGKREAFADKIVEILECYAPGIGASITHRELLTPVDIESEYKISGGHWHHGEMSIDQSFMMRPVHGAAQYDTPIAGLFLCGAAAHPGGGVTGMPGRNAAMRILSMGGGR